MDMSQWYHKTSLREERLLKHMTFNLSRMSHLLQIALDATRIFKDRSMAAKYGGRGLL